MFLLTTWDDQRDLNYPHHLDVLEHIIKHCTPESVRNSLQSNFGKADLFWFKWIFFSLFWFLKGTFYQTKTIPLFVLNLERVGFAMSLLGFSDGRIPLYYLPGRVWIVSYLSFKLLLWEMLQFSLSYRSLFSEIGFPKAT